MKLKSLLVIVGRKILMLSGLNVKLNHDDDLW